MTSLFYYLLKVTLCSGLLFGYYHFALKNKAFHQWNRFYLLSAVGLSLLLPVLQFHLFPNGEKDSKAIQLIRVVQSADNYLEEFTISTHQTISPEIWIAIGYAGVTTVLLSLLIFSLLKILSLTHKYPSQWLANIRFINTTEPGTPFSFFRTIFWNEAIPLQSETGKQIFQHELVHVKEGHTIDKLFMQAVLILFWYNPFFWLVRRELKFIHEFIADKKSVGHQGMGDFAAMILQTVYPKQYYSIINPFFQTSIKRRIFMLTKIQHPRKAYISRIVVLPVIAITIFLFSFRTKQRPEAGHQAKVYGTEITATQPFQQLIDSPPQKGQYRIDSCVYDNGDKKPLDILKALVIVNGKEYSSGINSIDFNSISSMNVLKGPAAIAKYGAKGSNGVIEITIKTGVDPSITSISKQKTLFGEKEIASVDVNTGKKELTISYKDGTSEILTEAEAQRRGLLNNDYTNRKSAKANMVPNQGMIITRESSSKRMLADTTPTPLYIIDGKEAGTDAISKINPSNIASINVLKDNMAIIKYGNKGRNGVVEIFMKQSKTSDSITIKQNDKITGKAVITNYEKKGNNVTASLTLADADVIANTIQKPTDPIFTETEAEASIDPQEWRAFLLKYTQPILEDVRKKAPAGTYTAYVRFLVNKDGKTSDYQIVKDPGYGIGDKLLAIMPNAPKWKPAMQNGKPVRIYQTQPITFNVGQ